MKKTLFALIAIVLVATLFLAAAQINGTLTNYQVKGWLFGKDISFAGERTWAKAATADTLVIPGVDTTCVVFLTAKTDSLINLQYDIRSAGDSVFVKSDTTGRAATDKYSYLIVRNGYDATD